MDIARAIREVAAERGLCQADISRISGLSDAHVTQIWHGKIKEPSAWVMYRVAHAMDATVDEIIERAQTYDG